VQSGLGALTSNLNSIATSLNGQMSTVNSLLGTRASTTSLIAGLALKQGLIEDGALPITKSAGLRDELDTINAIRVGMQASIASTATNLVWTQDDLTALTVVVEGKAVQSGLDALTSNLNSIATSLNGQMSTVNSLLGTRASTTSLTAGLALKQDVLGASSDVNLNTLNVTGATRLEADVDILGSTFANLLTAGTVTATNVNATTATFGKITSYLFTDDGTTFYFGYGKTYRWRFGKYGVSVGVNRDANSGYALDVEGSGRYTGSCTALSYITTSDARVKAEVEPLSVSECARLVSAIAPVTYRRTDIGSDDRRVGYIANHWDAALTPGMRNIMGAAVAEDGTQLLALDYSRIVPVLHGALLSALARIEALEGKVM
jgi:hypothetical protein